MRCKKCKTGKLIIYTEMIFTCRVPIDDEGEIEWLGAIPMHEVEDAQELESSVREIACTNCRAINDETGYDFENDQLVEISSAGKKETYDSLV